jgi:Zn finger protein HypA/HybF involved in hydrogenase expression
MEPITIDEFVEKYSKTNNLNKVQKSSFRVKVKIAVDEKRYGATCQTCGQPIWAIGLAVTQTFGCFTCITGEADNSDDFEIDIVC